MKIIFELLNCEKGQINKDPGSQQLKSLTPESNQEKAGSK